MSKLESLTRGKARLIPPMDLTIESIYQVAIVKKQATTTPTVSDKPVKHGHILRVDWITVENKTSAATSFRLVSRGLGEDMVLAYQATPSANIPYWLPCPVLIGEGRHIAVDYVGATSGDTIVLTIFGQDMIPAPKGE